MTGLVSTDVDLAAARLRAGGLVAVPTETVYGLAADATSPDAIARIYAAKGRPTDHPLIVHLADPEDLVHVAAAIPPVAERLASTAWPGPVTVIVERSDRLPASVAGGRDTVGVRVPDHPLTRTVIRRAGVPVAAPSANRFGRVSPTTARHVVDDLGEVLDRELDLVLDGGPSRVGLESTIVDATVDPPQILRAGGVPAADIDTLLEGVAATAPSSGPSRASGMLPSHYAPSCAVVLADDAGEAAALAVDAAGADEMRVLDLTDDVARYARDLYSELRRADADGVETLVAVLPAP
ncbi:MAG: L-threonylcarbamoyladenylate synthase, partial [Actinomycetota bacterium]